VKLRVLFLCATNGVQSPMAEALLNQVDSKHFEAISAGIDRGENHPLTVEVMKENGVDLRGRASKATHDVLDLGFDFVITLCDRARSKCPSFPEAELVHWQFDDPLAVSDPAKQKRLFRSLRDQIAQRIRLFALVQARFASVDTRPHDDPRSQPNLVHF
jgi:arsenate reductase